MHTTSVSLLERLRRPDDQTSWDRFVQLYTPLLYAWARRAGCPESEAADLVQEVLTLLVRKLPEFDYDPQKSFRAWLRTIAVNCWRTLKRRAELPREVNRTDLAELAAPNEAEAIWEAEYRQRLVWRVLALMRTEFEETTWIACWQCVVDGRSGAEVAAELGISVGAVYMAKSRVLSRIRQELAGLLD